MEPTNAAAFKRKPWKTFVFCILALIVTGILHGGLPAIGIKPILPVWAFVICFIGLIFLFGGKEAFEMMKVINIAKHNGGNQNENK
jgi:uncharacterized membrane protein